MRVVGERVDEDLTSENSQTFIIETPDTPQQSRFLLSVEGDLKT